MSIRPGFVRTKLGGWRKTHQANGSGAVTNVDPESEAGLIKVGRNYFYPTEEWAELSSQQQYACQCEAFALEEKDQVLVGPSAVAMHGYWVRMEPEPGVRTLPATSMAPEDFEDFDGALVERQLPAVTTTTRTDGFVPGFMAAECAVVDGHMEPQDFRAVAKNLDNGQTCCTHMRRIAQLTAGVAESAEEALIYAAMHEHLTDLFTRVGEPHQKVFMCRSSDKASLGRTDWCWPHLGVIVDYASPERIMSFIGESRASATFEDCSRKTRLQNLGLTVVHLVQSDLDTVDGVTAAKALKKVQDALNQARYRVAQQRLQVGVTFKLPEK